MFVARFAMLAVLVCVSGCDEPSASPPPAAPKPASSPAKPPTTVEADRILADKGVFIIPDILANSGGVIVSYFEWVQDVQRFFWKATDIQERLQDIIRDAFHRTLRFATDKGTSMRLAALISGIDKVAQAHMQRGLYP